MSTAAWSQRYIDRFGFKLVPLIGKRPIGEAWNADENLIATEQAARDYWSRNPHHNVGACLGPSLIASLDADDEEWARLVLAAEGIDLDQLITSYPTIVGRAPRIEFTVPAGIELSRKALVLPPKVSGGKPITVMELRAGRVQDVLPPSAHPDTHRPYFWLTPPRSGFPVLPDSLLRLWLDFDEFKRRARALCPWADPEPETPPRPSSPRQRTGPSVIAAFNDAHDVVAILEAHGYQSAGKKRWKSPNGHNIAGVILLRDGKKIRCYHTSDALGDERSHDAFDLYTHLEHSGDVRAAVRAAAEALGLGQGAQHGAR